MLEFCRRYMHKFVFLPSIPLKLDSMAPVCILWTYNKHIKYLKFIWQLDLLSLTRFLSIKFMCVHTIIPWCQNIILEHEKVNFICTHTLFYDHSMDGGVELHFFNQLRSTPKRRLEELLWVFKKMSNTHHKHSRSNFSNFNCKIVSKNATTVFITKS